MFSDAIKIALKSAALIAGVAIIVAVFASITLPSINLSAAYNYINIAYSIGLNYIPGWAFLWTTGIWLLRFEVTLLLARVSIIAVKWVLKVNE